MRHLIRIEVLAPVVFEHFEFAQADDLPTLIRGKAVVVQLNSQRRISLNLVARDAPEDMDWLARMQEFVYPVEPGKPPHVLALPVHYDPLDEPQYSLITGSHPAVLAKW